VLAPIAGYSVMFAVWAFVWVALAVLSGRILRSKNPLTWNEVLARGVAAAIGSGIAFYLISGIWRPFNPQGWDYAIHFLSWTVAYLPGFAALMYKARD
jgi:NO-binding membrane sensor protein with MHYT domain